MNTMKKILSLVALLVVGLAPSMAQKSFYDFTVETIDGQQFNFSELKSDDSKYCLKMRFYTSVQRP